MKEKINLVEILLKEDIEEEIKLKAMRRMVEIYQEYSSDKDIYRDLKKAIDIPYFEGHLKIISKEAFNIIKNFKS